MSTQESEFFDLIAGRYAVPLFNWAYRKLGNQHSAEDLVQEVFLQVFIAVQRELRAGNEIGRPDNLVWKIAHYVWCHYLRSNASYRTCVPIDDLSLPLPGDFAEDNAQAQQQSELIRKLRGRISRLCCMQREIMIRFYIENQPVKAISGALGISESNVKWQLFSTRKKLKAEVVNMSTNNYVYRPHTLHMALSGQAAEICDTDVINASLTKQNICISCYREPRSVDELADALGIPSAYIEYDLEWLTRREFVAEQSGKYSTSFIISDAAGEQGIFEIFRKHRADIADRIVSQLFAQQAAIRQIGFHGCDIAFDKLLWLLIYRCASRINENFAYGHGDELPPVRPDGGRYYPQGFDRSADGVSGAIIDTGVWGYNGPVYNDGFIWFGTYTFGDSEVCDMVAMRNAKWQRLHALLGEILCNGFTVPESADRFELAQLLQYGYIAIDSGRAVPDFAVFTREQAQQLNAIFDIIAGNMEDAIFALNSELKQYCKAQLPSRLKKLSGFLMESALSCLGYTTSAFAFNDGMLFKPDSPAGGEKLTLMYVIK